MILLNGLFVNSNGNKRDHFYCSINIDRKREKKRVRILKKER